MMTHYRHDENYARTRQDEIRADVENMRNGREARKNRKAEARQAVRVQETPFYAPALARAGEALVSAGKWLQTRYDETTRQLADDVSGLADDCSEPAAQC